METLYLKRKIVIVCIISMFFYKFKNFVVYDPRTSIAHTSNSVRHSRYHHHIRCQNAFTRPKWIVQLLVSWSSSLNPYANRIYKIWVSIWWILFFTKSTVNLLSARKFSAARSCSINQSITFYNYSYFLY